MKVHHTVQHLPPEPTSREGRRIRDLQCILGDVAELLTKMTSATHVAGLLSDMAQHWKQRPTPQEAERKLAELDAAMATSEAMKKGHGLS